MRKFHCIDHSHLPTKENL
uniref:Uncharacterized protein n=1 Tax=Rhizophora mucronata TaxID=61149 RepID=A0A2P2LHY7_RHIMU